MTELRKAILATGEVKTKSVNDERRIVFVASSNGLDRHYEHVDVMSLRLPTKNSGSIKVADIPEEGIEGIVDIPLMLNHSGDIRDVIGSVRKAQVINGELVFEAGISSLPIAQEMLTLIEEGHLSNAFSITMTDYDYNFDSETISNAEVIEVSLVYRGANKEARLLATKAVEEAEQATEDEKAKEEPTEAEVAETEEKPETEESSATEPEAAEEKPAEETTNNNEETEMDPEDAKAMVAEKAMPTQAVATSAKYLDTKEAIVDFVETMKSVATGDAAELREAWKAKLAAKGIQDDGGVLLPSGIVREIKDTVEKSGTILKLVDQTGLTVFDTALNLIGTDVEDGRAKGHKGNGATKKEEKIKLEGRTLRAQYIYKYLTIPKEMIRENQDTGALVKYVMSELPKRVIAEVERDIVIGDGRAAGSDDKVTSLISIKSDIADSNSIYAKAYTPESGENLYESIINAGTELEAEGKVYVIMSKKKKASLKLTKIGDHYVFGVGSGTLAEDIEVEDILTPAFMKNEEDYPVILVVLSEYKTVGDNTTQGFTNFALKENKQEYLEEIYIGGGLAGYISAVGISAGTGSKS